MQNDQNRKRGRILILDDMQRWRQALVEILERDGYEAVAVSSAQEVLRHLSQSLYHVLILDICLNESDHGNTDGWELLHKISELNLDGALKVMMVSAHETNEQVRNAFHNYNVSDFIIKSSFTKKEFQESIQRIFQKDLQINLKLSIIWSQRKAEALLCNLELDHEALVQPASSLISRLEDELDDLLRRLFSKSESILIRAMRSGYSGTSVLLIKPFYADTGAGRTFVVKFGDVKKIEQEYNNFKEFVEPFVGGKRSTGLLASSRTPLLGGIRYSLLGASGDLPEDFGDFYARAKLPQLKKVLDRLFNDTCSAWYANPGYLQPRNLTNDYLRILGFTLAELEQITKQFSTIDVTPERIIFHSLSEQEQRRFSNPLVILSQHQFVHTTYVCTQHGDLNQHNLLVDNDSYTWMIDFQSTGLAHILCDITTLDSIVRFQLLPANGATLEERLEMEVALCGLKHFSQVDQLPNLFTTPNPVLAKAFATVVHLRLLAKSLICQNPDGDICEYYVALFYNALNTLRYDNLAIEQREHALLCASLLADRIG
jgi:CheY-like chemotaxis protein